jgi:hypothetical protein
MANANIDAIPGAASAASSDLMPSTMLASWIPSVKPNVSGKGGEKDAGSSGSNVQESDGEGSGGPFKVCRASVRREWRRRSCEEMNDAECRSPVQRVISTQSRDWLIRARSVASSGRTMGCVGLRVRCKAAWVRRRNWRDWPGRERVRKVRLHMIVVSLLIRSRTYAFDYPSANAGDVSFDAL